MDLKLPSHRVAPTEQVPINLPIVENTETRTKTPEKPEQTPETIKTSEQQSYDQLALREYELRQESEDVFGIAKLGKEGYQQLVDIFGVEAVLDALAEVTYEGSTKLGDVIKSLEPDAKKRKALYPELKARVEASQFKEPQLNDNSHYKLTDREYEPQQNGPKAHNKRVAKFSLSIAESWENPLFMTALKLIKGDIALDSSVALNSIQRVDLAELRAELLANPNIYQVASDRRLALKQKESEFLRQVDEFITELELKIDAANENIELELKERRLEKIQELARAMNVLGEDKENKALLDEINNRLLGEIAQFEQMAEARREREVKPLEKLLVKANWLNR